MARRSRRLLIGAALASVAVVALSACSSPDASSRPGGDPEPATEAPEKEPSVGSATGFRPEPLEFEPCGGVDCATLEVPLDYEDPDGERISLSLVRVPAGDPDARIGAILVNPGGPGGSGVDFMQSFRFDDAVHERFDVIGFDPRGVGESTGLTCGGELVDRFFALDPDPDSPNEQEALDAGALQIATDCGADHGELLQHIGSADVVRDMDTIRRALGEEQISYVGFSYGTLLGARYAEAFPQQSRAIVLDGVVDPAHDFREWLTEQTVGFARVTDDVFAGCDADPNCPAVGGSAAYDQILARIETDPLPAGEGNRLGPGDLATAVIYATYDPSVWPVLYEGLGAALGGDGSVLFSLAESYRAFGGYTSYAAVECIDSPHPTGPEEFRAFAAELEVISPRFGSAIANELLPCAFWPVAPAGDPQPVRAEGSGPIFVIGNTGDAATPIEQARRVADTLENGVLLTYEGEGHTSYGSSRCVDDAVSAYLLDLTLPEEGTVCS